MRITAKSEYACKALLELALHWPNQEPLQQMVISQRQEIPEKFLTQILIILKQMGFVQSIRGKKGGYLLAKSPKEIKLLDILKSIEQDKFAFVNMANTQSSHHVLNNVWSEINMKIVQILKDINFESISHRQRTKNKAMMFEI